MARLLGGGRYVLGTQLGMGGMGTVYEAEDLVRTERVAIKILHAEHVGNGVVAEHIQRELRAGRAIRHLNVVAAIDGECEGERPFVVMELALGRTLATAAAEDRPTIHRAVAIVDHILAGLGAIHDAGYLHGDMKSDNVLVACGDDGTDVVKIIDLGLASNLGAVAPATDDKRVIAGTPDYIAPEIALGGAKTVASELYAVGVILYELLTGTLPFGGAPIAEILRRHVEEPVVPPSLRAPELRLSLALERVVLRALDKRPEARYSDTAGFRTALHAAMQSSLSDDAVKTGEFSTSAPTRDWTRPELPVPSFAIGTQPPASHGRAPNIIIEAALYATSEHVSAHRLSAAQRELEAALALVEGEPIGDAEAWRLLLALAAVCDGLRDARRARRVARMALDCAARAHSEVGRRRAKVLLERFAGRSQVGQ